MGERAPPAAGRPPPVLSPAGDVALAELLDHQPLLAFDFDGTLAAIVRQPRDARPTQALVQRLAALSALLPVAVVSGRALADLRPRLGFRPAHLVGNHGAEDEDDAAATARWTVALDPLRQRLQQQAAVLGAAGVTPEDKGPSIALHYRQARHAAAALRAIELFLQGPWLDGQAGPLKVFGGKRVVNVCAAGCPDKAAAVQALVARCGAGAALFAGDDVNDEPVFAAAPPHWLTVRVGRDAVRSQARFGVDSPVEMARLLDRLLALAQARRGAARRG